MTHRSVVLAAALLAAATLSAPAVAHAEPVAPQVDSACSSNIDGALTILPDAGVLQCRNGRWASFTDPYPFGDRWLSYGPELRLHGQGMRNPEVLSGDWTAYPQDPDTRCRAEQAAVVDAGEIGAPQISEGEPGQPLRFAVLPVMFSIELSGHCLWQKVG